MGRFAVDTGALAAGGAQISELSSSLTAARAAIRDVQGAAGATGEPSADSAIEVFAHTWGLTVVALQEAAVGLGRGAMLAAAAYDTTDGNAFGR